MIPNRNVSARTLEETSRRFDGSRGRSPQRPVVGALPGSPQLPDQVVQQIDGTVATTDDLEMDPVTLLTNRELPVPSPSQLISTEVVLRMTSVNSMFKLSTIENFRCNLESIVSVPAGKFCTLRACKQRSAEPFLEIKYPGFHGTCDVQRNGLVSCRGQRSIQEACVLSKRVAWDFIHSSGDETISVYEHKFNMIWLDGELPWKVNLNKLKKYHAEVKYEPQVDAAAAASVRFEELPRVSMSLYNSGKFKLQCTADCNPLQPEMPTAKEAARRLGSLASRYLITVPQPEQPLPEEDAVMNAVPKRMLIVPRRSERLASFGPGCPSTTKSRKTPDFVIMGALDLLTDKEQALFDVLNEVAKRVSRRELIRTFEGLTALIRERHGSSRVSLLEMIEKVADVFDIRCAPVDKAASIPEPPVSLDAGKAAMAKSPNKLRQMLGKRGRGRPPKRAG